MSDDRDYFSPPETPVECFCLHCGRVYTSDMLIAFRAHDGSTHHACPVPGCSAMGWEFDIFPVDDDDCTRGEWIDDDDFDEDEPLPLDESPFDLIAPPTDEPTFEPPRDWTPDSDRDDYDDDADRNSDRGSIFTREEYDQLQASGEIARKIEDLKASWKQGEDHRKNSGANDEDIPF